MQAECGFDIGIAIAAAGAGAEHLRSKGECIDAKACVACVQQFAEQDISLTCKNCGWRNANTSDQKHGWCTQKDCKVNDFDTCDGFRLVQEINL